MMLLPLLANAEAVEINGIYYNLSTETNTAEVTIAPDYAYSGDIVIPETVNYEGISYSVTSIGESAFASCSGLTSITIPNSVTSIGYYAFTGCSGLTSITIPNSVTSIGRYAFHKCYSLTSIIIGNSVTSIGGGAFDECSSLTSIIIGNSVTSIGGGAFRYCSSLTSIKIPNSVTKIGDVAFYGCSSLTTITIPNNVTSIEDGVFIGCSSLSSITIPNSVKSIGTDAFYGCSNLSSITIPDNVASIGGGAFSCTKWLDNQPEGLVYAGKVAYTYKGIMPKNTKIVLKEGTLGIGGGAFQDCSGLYSIVIPSSVISIGYRAICGCNGLTTIQVENGNPVYDSRDNCNAIIKSENNELIAGCKKTIIPNSVTCIGDGAFYYCDSLTSISIPNSVASIRDYAFYHCSSLASVTIPNSVTSIGIYAFSGCTGLTSFIIPNSVATIGEKAFSGCTSLTSIGISDGVIDIGNCAFRDCSSLSSIVFPNSITRIEDGILQDCRGLTSVTIPSSVTTIGSSAFYGCSSLTSITIPNSVDSIGTDAFYKCSDLTSISIPNSVTTIGGGAFEDTKWLDNQPDGLVYAGKVAYQYKGTMPEDTDFVVEEGTLSIVEGAFDGCFGMKSITIPNSLMSIGDFAFHYCYGLKSVTIHDIASWCMIHFGEDSNPLHYAHHLYLNGKEVKNLVIPNGVTSIGDRAFSYCEGLKSVTIPNSVTSIGRYAFWFCDSLTSVISYIEEPYTIEIHYDSFNYYNNTTLYVPIGTKEKYETADYWKYFFIVEMDLQSVDDGQIIDIGDEIDEDTNLDGNILGDIYFSIRDENGEYNPAEGCIVIKKPSDDSDIDGKDIFGEDFKDSYTGIVFKVGAGKGTINVQAQTTGNMVLKVKIGDGMPITMELEDKLKVSFPYSVSEDTYVYIYGGLNTSNNAKVMRKAESADGTLKIYGIEVDSKANDIESLEVSQDDIATIYNLNGHRINSLQRGVNIIRMNDGTVRKVVVK